MIVLFSGSSSGRALAGTLVEPHGALDIELAFDTTASMNPSIEWAKRDGVEIVSAVRDAFPDTRFSVVSFRDYGNPSGDYEVLQPMTADAGAVEAAFLKLQTRRNPSPFNSRAEEYNLVFQRSYTDGAIAWRQHARKVVVVIGDAQPHGAGTSGIAGCTDTSIDHYGLNTATVLAGMRAAQRTLVMIRQVSAETTASLECYESMAERAYTGGAARNGGDADLARPIVDLVQSALAPVTLRPDVAVALPGGSAGYTATVSNPNSFALTLRSVAVTLPAGFRYRSSSSAHAISADGSDSKQVRWRIEQVLRPSEKVSVHLRATAPRRPRRYPAQAVVRLELPGGRAILSTSQASLRVNRRLRSLAIAARAARPAGRSQPISLRAGVRIAFLPRARTLSAGRLLAGRLVLLKGRGRSLVLRARSYRIISFGSPTVLKLDVAVERVRALPACSRSARGSATIIDDQRLAATGRSRDAVVIAFGADCRIAAVRWLNTASSAARSNVTVAAK